MEIFSCLFCNSSRNETSIEHIIPQSIRGRLRSNNIICKNCNNKFGTEIDGVLRERFELIEGYLSLRRGDKRNAKASLKFKGFDMLLTANGILFKHPRVISKINNIVQMVFPNEKSLRKHYNKMKKKNPNIDVDKIVRESKKEYIPIDEPLDFVSEGPLIPLWRACGKIIYEYLFSIKKNFKISDQTLKNFILHGNNPNNVMMCLYYGYNPIDRNTNHIYHTILIEARKNEILIGYLELYSSLKVIYAIDIEYSGPPFSNGYFLDLISEDQFTFNPKKKIPLSKEELMSLFLNCNLDEKGKEYMDNFIKTSSKARIYPIWEELNEIYHKLKKKKIKTKLQKLHFIYKSLINELRRIGIENLQKAYFNSEIEYTLEITRILSRLLGTFLKWEMEGTIIYKIFTQL